MAVILAAAALAKAQPAAPTTGSRVKPRFKNALSELSNLPGASTTNTNVVVASKRISELHRSNSRRSNARRTA